MSLPKIFVVVAILLFTTIATLALIKQSQSTALMTTDATTPSPLEVELDQTLSSFIPKAPAESLVPCKETSLASEVPRQQERQRPQVDRIDALFYKSDAQLPIVETITYTPQVKWLKGRGAWLVDYAKHYNTSRHFISRSLAGKADYAYQKLAAGDQFNVLRQDKHFQFYLLVDTTRCELWFYYLDLDLKQSVLLKTYSVCLGRLCPERSSGLLTPQGKYLLGERIATYAPKVMGFYHGKQVEMMRIFGTRWIPFLKEMGPCSEPAKGFGIHGMPWKEDPLTKQLVEDASSLGQYQSDGCIRLIQKDVEELYAIIATRPALIEIVKDAEAHALPYPEGGG